MGSFPARAQFRTPGHSLLEILIAHRSQTLLLLASAWRKSAWKRQAHFFNELSQKGPPHLHLPSLGERTSHGPNRMYGRLINVVIGDSSTQWRGSLNFWWATNHFCHTVYSEGHVEMACTPLLSQKGQGDSGHWKVKCPVSRKFGVLKRFALSCWNIFNSFPFLWHHLAKHLFEIIFFHLVSLSFITG